MRNYHHNFTRSNVVVIDFNQKWEPLEIIRDELVRRLLKAFETENIASLTPSEETVMVDFLSWYSLFMIRGSAINAAYPRGSRDDDLPDNTAFSYLNLNTGAGLVFIGMFDDGYGEVTYGAERVYASDYYMGKR